jgi:hypothetical protein
MILFLSHFMTKYFTNFNIIYIYIYRTNSSIDGALTDIETLMLSLNVDTLSLGQIDSALKRRGVEEWPRMLIFERLYELANAAEKERYLYGALLLFFNYIV